MSSRTSITSFLLVILLCFSVSSIAQDGENLFKTKCAVCHKLSSEKLIGPGLANVHEKHSKEWFKSFVNTSQAFINSGDADAVKIFEEYGKMVMPDQSLADAELDALFDFFKNQSPAKSGTAAVKEEPKKVTPFNPSEKDVLRGRHLFTGEKRFKNRGAACISCHHVRKDDLTAGGILAKDLSDVFGRLGKAGTEGVITGLPYPEMKASYKNHKITDEEATMLTAFFKDSSENLDSQKDSSYTMTLLLWGVIGTIATMWIIPLIWFKRKKGSVNKEIYARQIQSIN